MKIKCTLLTLALSLPLCIFAQTSPAPANMRTIAVPTDYNTPQFRERLVNEAMANNSQLKILDLETGISQDQVKSSSIQWLDYLTVSGNLNEFTIDGTANSSTNGIQNNFFPRYNFGLSFSLGSLFTNAYNTKIARKNLKIAEETEKNAPLQLRSMVLAKFEQYVQAREILNIQQLVLNDEEAVYNLGEKKFKSNQISLEDFSSASKRMYGERSRKIELQSNLAIVKSELEALINAILIDGK